MTGPTGGTSAKPPIVRTLAILAAVAGAVFFAIRGPLAAMEPAPPRRGGSYDLMWMYSASRAWLQGGNPYTIEGADDAFVSGGGATEMEKKFRPGAREAGRSGLLYPPTTFVVMAPIGALPWSAAKLAWALVNAASLGGLAWALVRIAGLSWRGWRAWAVLALALVYAPGITATAFGQMPVPATALIALAVVARRAGRPMLAGALLALACALKPQHAGLFVVYEALRGRWRVVLSAAVVGGVIAGVGAGVLWARGFNWVDDLRANVGAFTVSGVGAPTRDNWLRFQMINLHYPLHEFITSVALVKALVFGVCGALMFGAWRLRPKDADGPDELLALAVVAAASLMVVYHRSYDAVVLLFPLAWCVGRAGAVAWWRVAIVGLPALVFVVNGAAALYHKALPGQALEPMTHWRVWSLVILPHQAWAVAMVGVGSVVVLALLRRVRSSAG